jgi:hypothetical protein
LARLHEHISPTVQRVLDYIARRQSQGAIRSFDPNAIMIAHGGMVHQYGLLTQIIHAPIPKVADEEMAQLLTRILMDGIRGNRSAKKKSRERRAPAHGSRRKAK